MKLMMSDYKVTPNDDLMKDFSVKFHGPKDSPYDGGVWNVHVELPSAYPYNHLLLASRIKFITPTLMKHRVLFA